MKVKSIAECSRGAFCNTFKLHQATIFDYDLYFVNFKWPLKTGFTAFLKVEEADVLLILHQKPELALEKLNQLPSRRFAGKYSIRA